MVGTAGAKPDKVLRLAAMNPGNINMVRELTAPEAVAYCKAHQHLLNHDEATSLIEIVRRNLAAFESCARELSKKQPGPGGRGVLQREAKIEVNRHFLNFLASVRQFLDHTETRLKREYAETPEVFGAFRKHIEAAFDGVFAYRFIYKLRNFSQHCGAPVGVVDFETTAIGTSGMTMHALHLLFDAEQLLRDGGDVWGPVKADLKKLGTRFPVDPLPRKVTTELESIWEAVRHAERPHLEASVKIILTTIKDVPPPYMTPACWRRRRIALVADISLTRSDSSRATTFARFVLI